MTKTEEREYAEGHPEHSPRETAKTGYWDINHPLYYASGIEPINYIESHDLNFALGNAIKYITRAGRKPNEQPQEALRKAVWYLEHEIERLDMLENHGLLIVPAAAKETVNDKVHEAI